MYQIPPVVGGCDRGLDPVRGHVRVIRMRVKPAHPVRACDEVRVRQDGRERVLVVVRVIAKRAGAHGGC